MVERSQKTEGFEVVIRPNRSSSWTESLFFLASISVVSLVIAISFSVMGFWMILPFTGVELLVLAVCLYLVARDGQRCEVISINEDTVRIAKGWSGRRRTGTNVPEIEYTFPTLWTRLEMRSQRGRWYPHQLVISSSGRWVEVGRFLPEEERDELARELEHWITRTI